MIKRTTWAPARRGVLLLSAAVLSGALAACGPGGEDSAASPEAPASQGAQGAAKPAEAKPAEGDCLGLSEEQVTSTLGAGFTKGAVPAGLGGDCFFGQDQKYGLLITVEEDAAGRWEAAHKIFGKDAPNISGLGDKAYFDPNLVAVDALKGDTRIYLMLASSPGESPVKGNVQSKLTTLAKTVVDNA